MSLCCLCAFVPALLAVPSSGRLFCRNSLYILQKMHYVNEILYQTKYKQALKGVDSANPPIDVHNKTDYNCFTFIIFRQ